MGAEPPLTPSEGGACEERAQPSTLQGAGRRNSVPKAQLRGPLVLVGFFFTGGLGPPDPLGDGRPRGLPHYRRIGARRAPILERYRYKFHAQP